MVLKNCSATVDISSPIQQDVLFREDAAIFALDLVHLGLEPLLE
jgi:hypothetical protein